MVLHTSWMNFDPLTFDLPQQHKSTSMDSGTVHPNRLWALVQLEQVLGGLGQGPWFWWTQNGGLLWFCPQSVNLPGLLGPVQNQGSVRPSREPQQHKEVGTLLADAGRTVRDAPIGPEPQTRPRVPVPVLKETLVWKCLTSVLSTLSFILCLLRFPGDPSLTRF